MLVSTIPPGGLFQSPGDLVPSDFGASHRKVKNVASGSSEGSQQECPPGRVLFCIP